MKNNIVFKVLLIAVLFTFSIGAYAGQKVNAKTNIEIFFIIIRF